MCIDFESLLARHLLNSHLIQLRTSSKQRLIHQCHKKIKNINVSKTPTSSNMSSSIDRLQARVIEKSCKTLNDYPNSSAKEISSSIRLLTELFVSKMNNVTLSKALDCKIIDGIIKIIDPPKKTELHKDENRVFTDSEKGILPNALALLCTLVQDGCVLADTISSFLAVKDVLFGVFKKILQKTSRKVSLDEFSSYHQEVKTKRSNNDNDDDDGDHESTATKELIDFAFVENVSSVSAKVMWFLGRLAETSEPCNCNPNNKAICHADLIVAEGFPAIMMKIIAFSIHIVKKRHELLLRGTEEEKQHQRKNAGTKNIRLDEMFQNTVWTLDRCVQPRNALLHRQLEQQNVIPLLIEAMSVAEGSPREEEIKEDAVWCIGRITEKIEPGGGAEPNGSGKKKKTPKTIMQKVVADGSLRKILKLTKFDNIDTICLREDDEIAFPTLRILGNMTTDPDLSLQQEILRHDGVAILVKLLDHENKEIRQEACWIIANLCADQDSDDGRDFDIATMFVLCGVMKKMTVQVKSSSQDLYLQRQCVQVIYNISYKLRHNIHPVDTGDSNTLSPEEQQRKKQSLELLHDMIEQDKIHLSLLDALQLFINEFDALSSGSAEDRWNLSPCINSACNSILAICYVISGASFDGSSVRSWKQSQVFQAMKSQGLGKILKSKSLPKITSLLGKGSKDEETYLLLLGLFDEELDDK